MGGAVGEGVGGRAGTKRPSLSQPDPGPSPSKRPQESSFGRECGGVPQGKSPVINGTGRTWELNRDRERDPGRRSGLWDDAETTGKGEKGAAGGGRRRNAEGGDRTRRRTSKYEEAKEINIPIVLEATEDASEVSRPPFVGPRDVRGSVGGGAGGGGLVPSNKPRPDLAASHRRPAQPDKPAASVNGPLDMTVNDKENVKPPEDREWTYSGLFRRGADDSKEARDTTRASGVSESGKHKENASPWRANLTSPLERSKAATDARLDASSRLPTAPTDGDALRDTHAPLWKPRSATATPATTATGHNIDATPRKPQTPSKPNLPFFKPVRVEVTEAEEGDRGAGELKGKIRNEEEKEKETLEEVKMRNNAGHERKHLKLDNFLPVPKTDEARCKSPLGGREVKVERRQSDMEGDVFKDCWQNFSTTLQEVLSRLQELSAELGQGKAGKSNPSTASSSAATTCPATPVEPPTPPPKVPAPSRSFKGTTTPRPGPPHDGRAPPAATTPPPLPTPDSTPTTMTACPLPSATPPPAPAGLPQTAAARGDAATQQGARRLAAAHRPHPRAPPAAARLAAVRRPPRRAPPAAARHPPPGALAAAGRRRPEPRPSTRRCSTVCGTPACATTARLFASPRRRTATRW